MDPDRYDELFHTVERWVRKARKLFFVADSLSQQTLEAYSDFISDREGASKQSPAFLEKAEAASAFSDARALLFGLAIENAAKARQIRDQVVLSSGGSPKGLRTDHNLLEHVRQLGVRLDKDAEEFLELLTYQTQTLSKFPIAKNVGAQNRFTGRAVGARQIESGITARIIRETLSYPELVAIFEHGHEIPTESEHAGDLKPDHAPS